MVLIETPDTSLIPAWLNVLTLLYRLQHNLDNVQVQFHAATLNVADHVMGTNKRGTAAMILTQKRLGIYCRLLGRLYMEAAH